MSTFLSAVFTLTPTWCGFGNGFVLAGFWSGLEDRVTFTRQISYPEKLLRVSGSPVLCNMSFVDRPDTDHLITTLAVN